LISINLERCSGCGACVEVCPTGAMYLVDGKAVVDQKLCRDCPAITAGDTAVCITACPTEAITPVTQTDSITESKRALAPRPEPKVIHVKTQSAPVSLWTSLLPVVGGALAWAGREIVPRLAEYLLYSVERRVAQRQLSTDPRNRPGSSSSTRRKGSGHQQRRRRRRRGD
jgi:Fe-S-cluster-containing dehydrogenase component